MKIKVSEQLRLKSYMPTPNDVPTIGYGSTGRDIKMGMTWTPAQAEARFSQYCDQLAKDLTNAIGTSKTTQHQFDAMFDLAYNIGMSQFLGSTVLREHRRGSFKKAQSAFGMWIKQKGKVLRGLVIRRAEEADIYDD